MQNPHSKTPTYSILYNYVNPTFTISTTRSLHIPQHPLYRMWYNSVNPAFTIPTLQLGHSTFHNTFFLQHNTHFTTRSLHIPHPLYSTIPTLQLGHSTFHNTFFYSTIPILQLGHSTFHNTFLQHNTHFTTRSLHNSTTPTLQHSMSLGIPNTHFTLCHSTNAKKVLIDASTITTAATWRLSVEKADEPKHR